MDCISSKARVITNPFSPFSPHPLFNPDWYRSQGPVLDEKEATFEHYLFQGWRTGRAPHPLFSLKYYLSLRSDVCQAGVEPLGHFVRQGWRELSNPHPLVDVAFYLSQSPSLDREDPLSHYVTIGWRHGLLPTPHFDPKWYLDAYSDVAASGMEPLTHFLLYGASEGRCPTAHMSSEDFLRFAALSRQSSRGGFHTAPASTSAVLISAVNCEKPEPGVRPPPLEVSQAIDWLSAIRRSVDLFAAFRARAPEGAAPDESALLAAKLDAAGTDQSLPYALISHAVSADIETDNSTLPLRERFASLNLVPAKVPLEGQAELYPSPILNRYNRMRLDATTRFCLDPAGASMVEGAPKISILVPVYRTPIIFLERAILSVALQTYGNWELLLVDDCSARPGVSATLEYYAAIDPRIRLIFMEQNGGISAATNAALKNASGDYIGLLDHDDMLTRDALAKIAVVLEGDPQLDLVYSDECKIDVNDVATDIFTKPDWSPYLLFNCMYTGHFSVYKKSVVIAAGGFRSDFDFSQDYDLVLRVAELNPKVHHLEDILYGWRMIAGSAAVGDKPTARNSNIAALQSAIDRRGLGGTAVSLPTANRVRRPVSDDRPLVSLIVPSDNLQNIQTTIDSIWKKTTYANYEILVVTNSKILAQMNASRQSPNLRIVPYDKVYNFSDKCNAGASVARGNYVIFFNDDVRVVSSDWIEAILECLTLPGVGVVGPKLLYEDGTIQHAGMVTGVRRLVGTAFHAYPSTTIAHFNFAQSVRETSLICGALLAMPKTLFAAVGGFDPVNAGIAHSDVDLCFRVRDAGYSCVYTPHAELIHIGHVSIGETEVKTKEKPFKQDKADIFCMRRWGDYCARDPYFPTPMRDILFLDSQEPFSYFPGKRFPDGEGADILIFSHDLSGSGAPKIVCDLAEIFLRAGCFVLVMSPEDGPMRARLVALGAHVIVDPLALTTHQSVTDLGKNFDAIFANTIVCWPVIEQFSKFSPVYWYVHETDLIHHFTAHHPGFVSAFSKARSVWAGSALSSSYLESFEGERVVLPYGVEEPPADGAIAHDVCSGDFVQIVVLATIEPRKGQDLALLGYLNLPPEIRNQCRLRIAGRINDLHFAGALHKLAQDAPDIEFEGALSFPDYLNRLRQADIVLCASRDDALPLVSLNALAEGKILVCSQQTGTSAFIENGVSGFVLPQNHPDGIAECLARIVSNRYEMSRIAAKAKEVFRMTFTKERFVQRVADALHSEHSALASSLRETIRR